MVRRKTTKKKPKWQRDLAKLQKDFKAGKINRFEYRTRYYKIMIAP